MPDDEILTIDEGTETVTRQTVEEAASAAKDTEAAPKETPRKETPAADDEADPYAGDTGDDEADDSAAAIEAEEEAAEEEAGEEEETPPEFPRARLAEAGALGMTEEMIQTFPDPQLLTDAVQVMATAMGQQGQSVKSEAAPAEEPPEPKKAPPEREAVSALDEKQYQETLAAFDAVTDEYAEEPVLKAMGAAKTLFTAQHAQIVQQHEDIGRLVGIVRAGQGRDDARELDTFVTSVDAEGETYGKGTYLEVDMGGEGFANRKKLAEQVDDIAVGMLERRKTLPPIRVLYQLAHSALFGAALAKTATRKEVKAKLARRKKGITPRAETEQSELPLGERRAKMAVAEQMGISLDEEDMADFEESIEIRDE